MDPRHLRTKSGLWSSYHCSLRDARADTTHTPPPPHPSSHYTSMQVDGWAVMYPPRPCTKSGYGLFGCRLTLFWRNNFNWATSHVLRTVVCQTLLAALFKETSWTRRVFLWYRPQRDVHLLCEFSMTFTWTKGMYISSVSSEWRSHEPKGCTSLLQIQYDVHMNQRHAHLLCKFSTTFTWTKGMYIFSVTSVWRSHEPEGCTSLP